MTGSGFQKTGWHWTRKGWKRTPKHLQTVKKIAPPPKRRSRKQAVAITPVAERLPTFAAARKLAEDSRKADSAPTPAAEVDKRIAPKPRRPWLGKYDDLTSKSDGDAG